MSREYYNTLKESKSDVKVSRDKAKRQKDEIFAIFRHTLRPMTPAEIWDGYGYKNKNTPLTSIRRAITNLESEGLLKKTDIQKPGVYGKLNYCWIYKEKVNNDESQLTFI
tara:strand:+ start:139 stop:468 length:330 start_codon:yes stop_codon:yes gene_type:complete